MKTFNIESSDKHTFDYGTYYLTRLLTTQYDPLLKKTFRKSYWYWADEPMSGELEFNLDDYVVVPKSFIGDEGDEITLDYIVGIK